MIQQHTHHNSRRKNLLLTIVLNIAIAAAQLVGGALSSSLSLISDGIHNLSDVFALVISYIADRLSDSKSNKARTYGYKRAEIIAAFINASMLIGVSIFIFQEAIGRFWEPVTIDSMMVVWLAGLSVIINLFCVAVLHRDAAHNLNMRSAYLHLLTDALTSVAVVIGGICIYIWQIYWIDSLLSIAISIYLVLASYKILLHALRVLMQFSPSHLDIDQVVSYLSQHPQVANVHHVHLWQLTENEIHFEAHIDFNRDIPLSEASSTLKDLREALHSKFAIDHAVLQPEVGIPEDKETIIQEDCKKHF